MKIDITFDHSDLVDQIRNLLAVKGLKPVDGADISFTRIKTAKGDAERYSVKVSCEAGDILDACPLCAASIQEKVVGAVPVGEDTPAEIRHYAGDGTGPEPQFEKEEEEFVGVLDEELGESTVPPGSADVPVDDGEGAVPSMASLRAQSDRIAVQKAREKKARERDNPTPSMKGESTRPPRPGEGV